MRVKFRFDYGTKLEPEQLAHLAEAVERKIELSDDGEVKNWETYEADLERVLGIIGTNNKIVLEGMADPAPLREIVERLERLEAKITLSGRPDQDAYFNARVNVHVPNAALFAVDEVEVREDECTDELRRFLEDGWRILAICPQPDQRRPDYILGRVRQGTMRS